MPNLNINIGARLSSQFRGTLSEVREQLGSIAEGAENLSRRIAGGASVTEIVMDKLKDKLMEITLGPVASFVVGIGAVNAALWAMNKATEATAEGLKQFSTIEDMEAAFRPLLGGAAQAKSRLAELAQFAASTPFELPEVAAASRTLEVLTRGALSTGDGLRLVGDVAAQTGAPFQEIAMWVGRLYDNLQAGRPVGEATARLQELGTLSGTTRAKIEELQKAGAAGNDVWRLAKTELDRASGSMAVASQTMTGLRSNLNDLKGAVYRAFAVSAVDQEKASLKASGDVMQAMVPIAEHLGEVLNDFSIPDSPSQWFPIFDAQIKRVIATALSAKGAINGMIDTIAVIAWGVLGATIGSVAVALSGFIKTTGAATAALRALAAAGQAQALVWNLSIKTLTANTVALAAQYKAAGAATTAAYAQAAAVSVLRGAVGSLKTGFLQLSGAILASPVGWALAAAAGIYLWVSRLERATQAQAEAINQHREWVRSMAQERESIVSVDDKVRVLTKRYEELAKARQALADAKTPQEKENAQRTVDAAVIEVRKVGNIAETQLTPGAERAKAEKELADLREKQLNTADKLLSAERKLRDAVQEQKDARTALNNAQDDAMPEVKAQEESQKKDLQKGVKAADKHISELDRQSKAASNRGLAGDHADLDEVNRLEEEKQRTMAERARLLKEISDIEAGQKSRAGGVETAKGTLANKDKAVVQAEADVKSARSDKDAQADKSAEVAAEIAILSLQSQGVQRTWEEYQIRQSLIEQRWKAAAAARDEAKAEEQKQQYFANQVKLSKELTDAAKANAAADRETANARQERADAQQRRRIELAQRRGAISPQQADALNARLLEAQQKRTIDDAARLAQEAKDARARGEEPRADQLDKQAQERAKEADALGYQAQDLRNPAARRDSPVVDSMQRVGGGGGAFYGSGTKDPSLPKLDSITKLLEKQLEEAKRGNEKDRVSRYN